MERTLRIAIAAAIAAVPVAGCGLGSDCGKVLGSYDVTFTPCAADAGTTADGGVCETTCEEACGNLRPVSQVGLGICTDFDAAIQPLTPGVEVTLHCEAVQDCTGRKLDGRRAPVIEGEPLAMWLSSSAWLEASAVFAFRRLARELHAHGAPAHLVRAARRSAREEIHHARIMSALARKHGGVVPPVPRAPREVRDLESIARENAVEGCVGETYGAAIAAWQAMQPDHDLACAMRTIAPDEVRHAALGWAVQVWIERRLSAEARTRVHAARDEAARELVAKARTGREEHAIARYIARALWAA